MNEYSEYFTDTADLPRPTERSNGVATPCVDTRWEPSKAPRTATVQPKGPAGRCTALQKHTALTWAC